MARGWRRLPSSDQVRKLWPGKNIKKEQVQGKQTRFISPHREPHHLGKESRVPVQPPSPGPSWEGEDPVCRDPCWAGGLGLRPAGAAGETRHRHETGNGAKVLRSTAIKDKEAQIGANCNRLISLVCVSVCLCACLCVGSRSWRNSTAKRERRPTTFWSSRDWYGAGLNWVLLMGIWLINVGLVWTALRIMRAGWRRFRSRWTVTTRTLLKKRRNQRRKVVEFNQPD